MPYDARVFRVLIASPSDVEDEREIAVRVIQEWNDLHSASRNVVLLPLRWETHTAPEYGVRPQEVINRAIVDNCDVVIGVFWTRVGTPTGVAESGTLEEIERVAAEGKPVMLYFSRVGKDPEKIELDQLERLNGFKERTASIALIESYKSQIEFRDKLSKQLELKVRDLQRADSPKSGPRVNLGFASSQLGELDGSQSQRTVEVVEVTDAPSVLETVEKSARFSVERVLAQRVRQRQTFPVLLGLANTGTLGIRSPYIEMDISSSHEGVELFGTNPDRDSIVLWEHTSTFTSEATPDLLQTGFKRTADGWSVSSEWEALQPKRVRYIGPQMFVRATSDATLTFTTKLFADSFAEPLRLEAKLEIQVVGRRATVAEMLPDLENLKTQFAQHTTYLTSDFITGSKVFTLGKQG